MNYALAWEVLKTWGPKLGWPLAFLFCYLWIHKQPVCPVVSQSQTQDLQVKLVYRDRLVEVPGEAPKLLPCPEIDFSASETHWQSVSQTPKYIPVQTFKLLTGLGYLNLPFASLGVQNDRLGASALFGVNSLGGQVTYSW